MLEFDLDMTAQTFHWTSESDFNSIEKKLGNEWFAQIHSARKRRLDLCSPKENNYC